MSMRIGYGYDSHAFKAGVPLVIGGLAIDHPEGLAGHSDGDVLLHAITDALLGALTLASRREVRGLRMRGRREGKSERPFHFELRHRVRADAPGLGRLEARVADVVAPPVPRR